MATLEDLGYESITDMSKDAGIELIRQIRLSRRTPKKQQKQKTSKRTASKNIAKKAMKQLDSKSINELLNMIGDD